MAAADPPMNKKTLAGLVRCSPATITNLFKPGDYQLRQIYKQRIENVLCMNDTTNQKAIERVVARMRRVSPERALAIAAFIETEKLG